nr:MULTISPECIES: hypothetical protein [unclassified Lebetimonas]
MKVKGSFWGNSFKNSSISFLWTILFIVLITPLETGFGSFFN